MSSETGMVDPTTLERVVAGILETQAYMLAEACPSDELETDAETYLRATIVFLGPTMSGCVAISTTLEASAELAANVLGVETDDPVAEQEALDAMKELANVVCGQLLTSLYGSGSVFQLSIPVVEEMDAEGWRDEITRDDSLGLLADDQPITVRLSLEESAG